MKVSMVMGAIAFFGAPAFAQTAIDGDSFQLGRRTVRLYGIDAPDPRQTCPDGWPAGELAQEALQALITGRELICKGGGFDRFGRNVVTCTADGFDIGAEMVRNGMARAFSKFSTLYIREDEEAKAADRGLHAHGCAAPWEWRAALRKGAR